MKTLFKSRTKLTEDKGAVAVEFAIIIPLFIAAVLSLSDISGAAVERMRMERALAAAEMMVEQHLIRPGAYDEALSDIVGAMLEGDPASEVVVEEEACEGPGKGKCKDGKGKKNLKMKVSKKYASQFIGDFEITSVAEVETQ